MTAFHPNWVHAVIDRSHGELGRFTAAHDPVRRGFDQLQRTQFGWKHNALCIIWRRFAVSELKTIESFYIVNFPYCKTG